MEGARKLYHLNKGSVLDERYETGDVLGEGGFGITYAGTNIRSGREVAIKEFFCLDYMGRSEDGVSVVLTDKNARRRFNTEKTRFMREARILGEFKDDPGVVTVLDYFEAGGTAYLVMEYLSGDTLHDHVKDFGPYDPKTFFEEIRPLMHTLAKVHEAGVIHRDISPDNIMRMDDGSVVLIDFGSAKDLSGRTITTATTYKDGFAPPEQYSSGKKLGPETDIYALAATFYYCLTGTRPESAIQRVMFDELRPLHELAGGIPEDIEQMIAKGMALMQADRFRTVTEMEDIIDAHYPLLSPEEKERIRKKKKMRRICLAAAGVLLLSLLTVHFVRNSTMYKMRMQDTQVLYLSWEDTDDEAIKNERKEAEEIIEKRLEVLAGKNNYLWNVDSKRQEIAVEIPLSVLKGNEPDVLFTKYITRTFSQFRIAHTNKDGEPVYYDNDYQDLPVADFDMNDIKNAETGEGSVPTGKDTAADLPYVRIEIEDPGEDVSKEFLQEKGQLLSFIIPCKDHEPRYIPGFAEGDGKTVYLVPQESVDDEEFSVVLQNAFLGDSSVHPEIRPVEGERFRAALEYDIEHEATFAPMRVLAEPSVTWETPDNILSGDNQVSEGEISGETLHVEWVWDSYSGMPDSEWINAVFAMKKRLDALDIPYAVGAAPYNENMIAVKFAEKDISQAEILMLGINPYINIYNGAEDEDSFSARLVRIGSGEDWHVEANGIYSSDSKEFRELIDKSRKKSIESLKVSLGYKGAYPVGSLDTDDISDAQLADGRLALAEFGIGGDEKERDAADRLIKLINVLMTEKYESLPNLYRLSRYDAGGKYVKDIDVSVIEGGFYPEYEKLAARIDKDIIDETGSEPGFGADVYVEDGRFNMIIYDGSLALKDFEYEAVRRAEELFKRYDFADTDAKVEMRLSNLLEVRADSSMQEKLAIMKFDRFNEYSDGKAGEYGLNKGYYIQIKEDEERMPEEEEKSKALLDELIRKSDVFGKIIG